MRDRDIRQTLRQDLTAKHADEPDTLIVDELALCQGMARVDMAVVNGFLSGYEIKSDKDTLTRLPAQCFAYNRVFDYVVIVTATNHLANVLSVLPNGGEYFKR